MIPMPSDFAYNFLLHFFHSLSQSSLEMLGPMGSLSLASFKLSLACCLARVSLSHGIARLISPGGKGSLLSKQYSKFRNFSAKNDSAFAYACSQTT